MKLKQKQYLQQKAFNLDSLSLGSYTRGEATEDSDIDFFFDNGGLRGLFQYAALINKLEEVFGCSVDAVSTGINNKEFIERIKKESVLLYEKV